MLYDIMFTITIPIFAYSIYLLNKAFLGTLIKNNRIEVLAYVIYSFLMLTLFFITQIPVIFLIFNIISFFLLSLMYQSNMMKKFTHSITIYSILFVVEIIVSGFIGYLDISIIDDSSFNSSVGILVIRLIIFVLCYCIYKFKKNEKQKFVLPIYYYIAYIVMLFGTLYLFVMSLESESLTIIKLVISGLTVLITNLAVVLIDTHIYKLIIMKYEYDMVVNERLAYENQKEIINQSLINIRSIKHDLTNQIIVLNQLHQNNEDEAFDKYINKMLSEIKSNKNIVNSNNFVVDSILNFKLQSIYGNGVDIKMQFNIPRDLNILAFDLTIILGNLIDNSITAIKEIDNKFIKISISYKKNNLIILIDNSYNGKLNIQNGVLKTTKPISVNHGLGINNVQKTIDKYGGEFQVEHTSDVFSVSILLPDRTM